MKMQEHTVKTAKYSKIQTDTETYSGCVITCRKLYILICTNDIQLHKLCYIEKENKQLNPSNCTVFDQQCQHCFQMNSIAVNMQSCQAITN